MPLCALSLRCDDTVGGSPASIPPFSITRVDPALRTHAANPNCCEQRAWRRARVVGDAMQWER